MAWYDIFQRPWMLRFTEAERTPVSLTHAIDEEVADHKVRRDHEYGAPGNEFWSGSAGKLGLTVNDYNTKFLIPQLYDTVQKMKLGDSSITAALTVLKLPILRTEVRIIPGTDKSENKEEDKLLVEACQEKLLKPGAVHETWEKQLRNFLLMLDYGFSVSEKVWTQDDDGFLRFKRIAARLPPSVTEMQVHSDGSLAAVIQNASKGGVKKDLKIPAPTYAAVMSYDKEGENHWGRSVLRAMYKHWFYKEEFYRIDAVRLDRWGTGIPKAMISKDYMLKTQDKADLQAMLSRLRGSEQAYIMHPEQVEIKILTPEPGGSTDLGLMNSVYHHDLMIYRSILAHFIATANAEYGNYGSTRTYAEIFFFAEQALANYIEEEYSEHVIKPFCDANFQMEGRSYPRLQFADVQKFDMGILSESLSRFGLGGFVTPDDDLEAFIRKSFGWPALDPEISRKATGIQNPAKPPGSNTGDPFEPGPGQPPKSTDRQDQKVDQRPVQNMVAMRLLERLTSMQERIFNFVQGG